MSETHWDRLIHGHLDNTLGEAEQAEFAELMLGSEAARLRFWDLAEVHGLARDAACITWPDSEGEAKVPHGRVRIRRSVPSDSAWLRTLGSVAAGLLLGVLMTGLAWAIAGPVRNRSLVLLAEGFETGPAPAAGGVPSLPGQWSGDLAEVVPAQFGVQPASPRQMLRFLRSDFTGKPNPGGYIGDIYHLIDLRDFRGEIAGEEAVVQVSALFNAAPFADDHQYHCSVALYALDRQAGTDGSTREATALSDRALAVTRRTNDLLDRNPASWQKVSTELRLPPNTEYLLLRIAVAHGQPTRSSPHHASFPAHYADDVRAILVRRPLVP